MDCGSGDTGVVGTSGVEVVAGVKGVGVSGVVSTMIVGSV